MTFAPSTAPDLLTDLRRRILALDLPPGAALSRAELMAGYRVSSTPLRDALLRLQEDGLVEIHPQSRTLVSLIDIEHAREAHFMRSAVEQAIVHRLAAMPDVALTTMLDHIVGLQAEQAARGDLHAFMALDQSFHRALFETAGLTGLLHLVQRQSGHIDRIRALHLPMGDKTRQIMADHRRIVAMLRAADPDGAREAMSAHLSQSIALSDTLRQGRPAFFRP